MDAGRRSRSFQGATAAGRERLKRRVSKLEQDYEHTAVTHFFEYHHKVLSFTIEALSRGKGSDP